MTNNNITNEQIFDLIKMGIQVEQGMRREVVLSIETLNNMSTMLMYFRKLLSIDVDPGGELVRNLTIAKDTFSDPITLQITVNELLRQLLSPLRVHS